MRTVSTQACEVTTSPLRQFTTSPTHQFQAVFPDADYLRVWGRTFAEVLDDALGIAPGPAGHASRDATAFTRQPAHPFLFVKPPAFSGVRVSYETTPTNWAKRTAQAVPERQAPAASRGPRRTLTPVQQQALDALNAFGAGLHPDFTASELRRAYRQIAQRLHPDRHPHSTDLERARLTRAFADASDSYRRLLAIVDPRH